MTEGIVDFLECVDVYVEEAQGLGVPASPGNASLQKMLELHAIGNLRQRIDARQVTNTLLGAPALGMWGAGLATGSTRVFMLIALLVLFDTLPGHSFAMEDMIAGARGLPEQTQILVFLGFLIGFGVKMPIFPIHGWLPLAHVEAPSPVSILLSGILPCFNSS